MPAGTNSQWEENIEDMASDLDALVSQSAKINANVPTTEASATVGTSSGQVLAANAIAKYRAFCNDSPSIIYLAFAGTAIVGKGIRLNPNGGSVIFDRYIPNGAVNAIATGVGSNLTVTEG